MIVGFGVPSSINGFDETLGCEFLYLSRVHSIEDQALRFRHVAQKEETPGNAYRLIFIGPSGCVHVSMRVHWSLLISVVITPQMNC